MQPLEDTTVGGLLRRAAAHYPDRPALTWKNQVWCYAELDTQADRFVHYLLTWGVRKGDHLGIWCEAEPSTIFLIYAAARIGAVSAMLNTSLSKPELKALLIHSDIHCLVIGDGYRNNVFTEICRELNAELPHPIQILYIGQQNQTHFSPLWDPPESTDFPVPLETVSSSDPAFLLYTSGTTSLPKAVLDSHHSRANSGIQQALDLGATENDRFCVAMPVFHCFSLTVNVMAACACGGCLCLPESRRTESLLQTIQTQRCTVFSCVPTLFHALLARKDLCQWNLTSLRTGFIGGSSYPPSLFRQIEKELGFTLLSSLGQTEATAGITTARLTDPLDVRACTIGHFLDHLEGKIACPNTGESLSEGIPGEICVRGYMVMQGYYKQPEETAKVIDADGWLHTGDLGYLDSDGNVHYSGRLKDLIIRAGENISPREIELALLTDSRIQDCRAIGVPDVHYGEEICLCVIPSGCNPLSEQDIRDILKPQLSEYKLPRYILFMDTFPTTQTGKVSPMLLRSKAIHSLALG